SGPIACTSFDPRGPTSFRHTALASGKPPAAVACRIRAVAKGKKLETGRLRGEVAIVTGAGSGIGRAVALALAREGAAGGLVGRTRAKLGEVDVEISSAGGEALVAVADVRMPSEVERAVREVVEALGRPSILINNAGDAKSAPLAKTTLELWNELIAVNLTS